MEETTLTLHAVEAASLEEELESYLDGLPAGQLAQFEVRGAYRLEQPATTVGRHPDSEIFLDDITVSRRHVLIERDDSGYILRDVGSLNGTYVNRRRVDEARLRSGDELQIGRYRIVFVLGGDGTG